MKHTLIYRCRLCAEVFEAEFTLGPDVSLGVDTTADAEVYRTAWSGMAAVRQPEMGVYLTYPHPCPPHLSYGPPNLGLADLIGVKCPPGTKNTDKDPWSY